MQTFENIHSFFTRYKQFNDNTAASSWAKDEVRFSRLLKEFSEARVDALKADRQEASNYNIFSILNIRRRETVTHTPFLTNLLNPTGSHAQGSLFYLSFIKHVLPEDESIFSNIQPAMLRINSEWHGGEYGRMDIFAHHLSSSNRFTWILENKIGAGDQIDQLVDYYKYMEDRLPRDRIKLFYLTPDGRNPSSASIKTDLLEGLKTEGVIKNLGYQTHIVPWLQSTLNEIRAESVRQVVSQYIQTIKEHCI